MLGRIRAYNFAVDIHHVERMPLRHSMFLRIAILIAMLVRILPNAPHNFAPVAKNENGQRISDGAPIRDASLAWLEKWLG